MHQIPLSGNVSFCHLIGYLLQLAVLFGVLLCQITAQMPNTNRPVCVPHCQEVRVPTVEGQTGCGSAPIPLINGGSWPQGPAAQVKYQHLTCERNAKCVRGQVCLIHTNTVECECGETHILRKPLPQLPEITYWQKHVDTVDTLDVYWCLYGHEITIQQRAHVARCKWVWANCIFSTECHLCLTSTSQSKILMHTLHGVSVPFSHQDLTFPWQELCSSNTVS